MKFLFSALALTLLAGAAAAQQPAQPEERAYEIKDGRLVRRAPALPPGCRPNAGRGCHHVWKRAPGQYRSETYSLRVQVPVPHPDTTAVVSPGPRRDELPQQPLPPVRLVPGSGRRVQ